MRGRIQVAVDVGGTFTDVVAYGLPGGRTVVAKVLSTPDAPAKGVLDGIRAALDIGEGSLADVGVVRHGTTIATNAVLERRVARTALIVTHGFRDILYVGRQARPSLYDLRARHPAPLVPRHLTFEIEERTTWAGEVEQPAAPAAVAALASRLRAEGVEAVAVCLLHAYANGANEETVRDALRASLPGVPICLSSEICPEIGEYERASTTTVNAAVMPKVARYVKGLRDELASFGPGCQIYIMQSNGGAMGPEVAADKSVHTMYSGPSGGVAGARLYAREAGLKNAITLDVGGTSADVGVIVNDQLQEMREGHIGGLPIRIPLLEIHSVGAGGGSIAWIDGGGALRVGPHSASADPGPMCYGRGGSEPTLTDAHVVLGAIGAATRLGGRVALDAPRAAEGLNELAHKLDMATPRAAAGVVEVANATMVRAIRLLTVQRGLSPSQFALVALGGAGPLHAVTLARALGIGTVLVPPHAGVLSAVGMLATTIRHDFIRTRIALTNDLTPERARRDFEGIVAEALAVMRREGFEPSEVTLERWADMRYRGQAFELQIRPVCGTMLSDPRTALAEAFHEAHRRRYGFGLRDEPVEVVHLGVTALAAPSDLAPALPTSGSAENLAAARVDERPAWFDGVRMPTAVYARHRLPAEVAVHGPAVIEGTDSTTLVPPEAVATADRLGTLVIRTTREEAG